MPARINRRCITVTSLGDCGMMLPSFLMISWKARLGWVGACSASTPPTTRSTASLGLTYNFMSTAAAAPVMIKNSSVVSKNIVLDLDLHDLFHHRITDQLQHHRGAQHDVADVVVEKELHVVRIGEKHQDAHGDRNDAQRRGRHLAVSADRPDAPSQLEALADYICQLVQNLGQIAAGALLQQHRRNKKM